VRAGYATPKGVYRLKYKQKNTVLRGEDYAVPVTFWMPFNGGVGLHDASWRSVFGGSIYETNGSHGCVNMPYNVAKPIFDNIDVNTPVICY
jgi:lipoprotein-anchoring transpeptidase ErfK/SrfK